ncbi:hypothetical protein ASE78_17190 [Sphingomonas sp. Leaf25]|nr:hypothetical protein ASE78_17190 [Sphingomonas sp. Leaf25]
MRSIAIFIRTLRSGGGAQRAMVRFATGLHRRGYAVTVLTLLPGDAFATELDPAIPVVRIGGGRLLRAVSGLATWLRRNPVDTLFTTEPACNVVAALAGRLSRTGVRVVLREGLFPSVARRDSPYAATRFAYRLAPLAYPRADAIIAIAKDMAADLANVAKLAPERITTIAVNPVVTPHLLHAATQEPSHAWLSDGGSPIILGVGRLEMQKDFGTLIRAFARLRATRPCRLVIFGEGSERARLEAAVAESGYADDIALPGHLPQPFAAMRCCDVFVLSSRYEGLPNVLVEAIACGAPVVAADCPSGPTDVLEDGQYGPLVPVGDDQVMMAAIAKVLDNPPDRERLKERGLDFTVDRSLDRYLPVLFPAA